MFYILILFDLNTLFYDFISNSNVWILFNLFHFSFHPDKDS